jgi:PAS domain S-box-containing protein
MSTQSSASEATRVATLREYDILDTPPEEAFEEITQLVAEQLDAPIALISLVDEHRQWFKSAHGLTTSETPREHAFCAHALSQPDQILQVLDASHDARFQDNPLVTADPKIRFYAGAPLVAPNGQALGTLCVIDTKPRPALTLKQQRLLQLQSKHVIKLLELRKRTRQEQQLLAQSALGQARQQQILELTQCGGWYWDAQLDVAHWDLRTFQIMGLEPGTPLDRDTYVRCVQHDDRERVQHGIQSLFEGAASFQATYRVQHPDGTTRWVTSDSRLKRTASGEPAELVGYVQDITALKDAAREREHLLESLQVVQELSDVSSFVVFAATELVECDPRLQAQLHLPQAQLTLARFLQLFPQQESTFRYTLRQTKQQGTQTFQLHFVGAKEERWFRGAMIRRRSHDNNELTLVASLTDITAETRQRQQLQQSLMQQERLFTKLRLTQDIAQIGTFEFFPTQGRVEGDALFWLLYGISENTGLQHRTPNTEHRTTEHRTPNTEHRTPNTEHRTPNTEHRTPNTDGNRELRLRFPACASRTARRHQSLAGCAP